MTTNDSKAITLNYIKKVILNQCRLVKKSCVIIPPSNSLPAAAGERPIALTNDIES